jgi:membrane protein YqaA with SNARE-associated domain
MVFAGKTVAAVAAAGWVASLYQFVRRLGPYGLFILGIADSSFFFLPFGNDLLLIALVAAEREGFTWVLYVLLAAAGSLVGAFLVDLVMRKVGEEGLENFVKKRTVDRLRRKVESHAGGAVFLATVMPPPFPFTAVVMTASALQARRRTILLAVFFGRVTRFTVEALLAIRYGEAILGWIESDAVQYAVIAFAAIAIVGTAFSIRKWLRGRKSWSGSRASAPA